MRYALVLCLVLAALWLELRPHPTERYPFARADLAAGSALSPSDIAWRDLPAGFLEAPSLDGALARPVRAGEPLRPSDFSTTDLDPPDGWWSLELDLPSDVVPGQQVRLVVLPSQGIEPPDPIPAVVVSAGSPETGPLATGSEGRIAVPPELAATAATAVAENRVTVLLGSPG